MYCVCSARRRGSPQEKEEERCTVPTFTANFFLSAAEQEAPGSLSSFFLLCFIFNVFKFVRDC